MQNKIRVFYSYSHADEGARNNLETHLSIMKRQNLIEEWHDRKIMPGGDWEKEIDFNIEKADIILVLISADFIASDYCYGKELSYAHSLHQSGRAKLIPLIIRPVDWQDTELGKLQALPKDGKPVATWLNRDEAWLDIAKGIKEVVKEILSRKPVNNSSSVTIHEIMRKELQRISSITDRKDKYGGLQTGFVILDQITDGLHAEDVVVIAGRPSMGTSDLALNIAFNLSASEKLPIVIFSMRLTPEHIFRRLVAYETEIPVQRIVRGEFQKQEWPRITKVWEMLAESNITIENYKSISDSEISAILKNRSDAIGILIVDGAEFITSSRQFRDRNEEIANIARELKLIAQRYKIPVIITINTSRESEFRPNKRPFMGDLNEWEILTENVANMIFLVYRDEVYYQDREDNKGMAEIIVTKNDYGSQTTIQLAYFESTFAFRNLYYEEIE